MTTILERLSRYITQHSISNRIRDGKLQGLDEWTNEDGSFGETWQTIEPNIKAVRAWLGY